MGNSKSSMFGPTKNTNKKDSFIEDQFIKLEDLVYAPVGALAESNMRLHGSVINAIKHMGTLKQEGKEQIIHLENINLAYEHLKPGIEEGYDVETIQLQVPLLSIVPIQNLNIKNAEIDFSTEVKILKEEEDKYSINGRVCSPQQRDTDFLPRVSYKMRIQSIPAMEGLLRVTDSLSAAPVAKQLGSTPVAPTGDPRGEQYIQMRELQEKVRLRENKLTDLYKKITDAIEQQEKLKELKKTEQKNQTFDKEKYMDLQDRIMDQIMQLKEQRLKLEIKLAEEEMF